MLKFAILTRRDYRSPRILAESLKCQIEKAGHIADVYLEIDSLSRLNKYNETDKSIKFHYWVRKKVINYLKDKWLIHSLKKYDAIVISECTPNGFWKELYHIEKLRYIIKVPVLYYEVYYLGNAPTQIDKLNKAGDPTIERYDFHLAVTEVTEIKTATNDKWSSVGLDMNNWNLSFENKIEFIALIDFAQEGYETYRQQQIKVLEELNIKYITLSGNYSVDEIRYIYKQSVVYFMQSSEAFGLPIAECLACGVQIFTPNSSWPMSWRLDNEPKVHGPGMLPECFTVYNDENDLKNKLLAFKKNYNSVTTSKLIFDYFILNYPNFYNGNPKQVQRVIEFISSKSVNPQ